MFKLAILLTSIPIFAQPIPHGTWDGQVRGDNVYLNIRYTRPNGYSFYTKTLQRSDVDDTFRLVRPAGTVTFRALTDLSDPDGTWIFTPNGAFAKQLDRMGFDDLFEDRLFILAMSDLTVEDVSYLKQTKQDLTTLKLVQLCNHGVTHDYVRALRRERNA